METNIRWHGRARHGTKTAVKLLSQSIVLEDRYVQAYPDFHCSHLGEPIIHFTRIRDVPFVQHSPPIEPSIVVVMDGDLFGPANVLDRLTLGGLILANTPAAPEKLQNGLDLEAYRVSTLDGTAIAKEHLGEDLPNTAILGALVKITGLVDLETLEGQIKSVFGFLVSEDEVMGNVRALHNGYKDVRLVEALIST
jgi:pyruvate ferredoxin oxidoreductase gamma subunit